MRIFKNENWRVVVLEGAAAHRGYKSLESLEQMRGADGSHSQEKS